MSLCKYLNSTKDLHLVLSIDDMKLIKWYIDASYVVHEDFCSHLGLVAKFGHGSTISATLKQKLNTDSLVEAELVGVDGFMAVILWMHNFWKCRVMVFLNTFFTRTTTALYYLKKW